MRIDTTAIANIPVDTNIRQQAMRLPSRAVVTYFFVIFMVIGAVFPGTLSGFCNYEKNEIHPSGSVDIAVGDTCILRKQLYFELCWPVAVH